MGWNDEGPSNRNKASFCRETRVFWNGDPGAQSKCAGSRQSVQNSPAISNSLDFETYAYFTIAVVALLLGLFLVLFGARPWA